MYTVQWLQTALDELTELWVQADSSSRQAITAATHQIDRQLTADPSDAGESRADDRRILFESPLAVDFRVLPNAAIVEILHVWRYA
jgi:hypothetical protein